MAELLPKVQPMGQNPTTQDFVLLQTRWTSILDSFMKQTNAEISKIKSGSAAVTDEYFQGYHDATMTWDSVTGPTSYADMVSSGATPSIMIRQSNGIVVTTAGSSLPGISFIPASIDAAYLVTASFSLINRNTDCGQQLVDGNGTVIGQGPDSAFNGVSAAIPISMGSWIFSPKIANVPVTVKIQSYSSSTVCSISSEVHGNGIEWSLVRIA